MSAGNIRLALDIAGVQNAREAADELTRIRQGLLALQSMTGASALPAYLSPTAGLSQGRMQYGDHMREITDMWKLIRESQVDYANFERGLLDVGKAYGYTRDQALEAADAFKQVQQYQQQIALTAGSMGFARGFGMDPGATGRTFGQLNQLGVINTSGDQRQFMFMLAEAVSQGSRGGTTILLDRLMPLIQDLTTRQISATPYGANAQGITSTLTRFNASGIPGLRNEYGAQVYSQLDASIKGATTGFSASVMYEALKNGRQDYGYADYLQDIAQGASNPENLQRVLQAARSFAPSGSDDKSRNLRALYMHQALPNLDVATLKALDQALFNDQGQAYGALDLGGLQQRYGATGMDPTYLGVLTRLDEAGDNTQLGEVLKTYETLTGGKGPRLTGDFAKDKAALGKAIASTTTPAMGMAADRQDRTTSDIAKTYEDAAKQLQEFAQKVHEVNLKIAEVTGGIAGSGIGGPMIFGAHTLGTAVQTVFQGTLQALMVWSAGSSALGFARTAAGRALTPNLGGPWTTTAPGQPLPPGGPGGTASAGAASILARFGPIGLSFLAAGASGALSGALLDRLGGGEGRNPLALPLLAMSGIGTPLATTGSLAIGAARHFGWGGGLDNWLGQHLPGYNLAFGQRTTPGDGSKPPTGDKQDDQTKLQQRTNELLEELVRNGVPRGTANDIALQAQYGARVGVTGYNGVTGQQRGVGPTSTVGPTGSGGAGFPAGSAVPGQGFGSPGRAQVAAQLAGRGKKSPIDPDMLIALANEYGVPVNVLLAILNQESGYGTDDTDATRGFNYGGLKDPATGEFQQFGSVAEGLRAVVANAGSKMYQGLTLRQFIAQWLIGDKNASLDATDSAGNKLSDYINNALGIINKNGGNASMDDVVTRSNGQTRIGSTAALRDNGQEGYDPKVAALLAGSSRGAAAAGAFFGTVELVIKQPDGSTDRQWVTLVSSAQGAFAGIRNYPTKGV